VTLGACENPACRVVTDNLFDVRDVRDPLGTVRRLCGACTAERMRRDRAVALGPCPHCGDVYRDCLCWYDHEPTELCGTCGQRAWFMYDGWCCRNCDPNGPWLPGFGPDDDGSHRDPLMTARVQALAGAALGVPADDVVLA
jgi:hypothetical protein